MAVHNCPRPVHTLLYPPPSFPTLKDISVIPRAHASPAIVVVMVRVQNKQLTPQVVPVGWPGVAATQQLRQQCSTVRGDGQPQLSTPGS